jgi:hypothetical protein
METTIQGNNDGNCYQILSCKDDGTIKFKLGNTDGSFASLANKEYECKEGETITLNDEYVIHCPKANLICAPMPCLN